MSHYLEKTSDQKEYSLDQAVTLIKLTQDVVRTAGMIVKLRKDNSFTRAELKFIQNGMIKIYHKYIPDSNKRREFIKEIINLIPGDENGFIESESQLLYR